VRACRASLPEGRRKKERENEEREKRQNIVTELLNPKISQLSKRQN
jgi:hypothetical protein